MTREHWKRIGDIFEQTAALPAEQRSPFLAQACGEDRELSDEVESLLAHDALAGLDFRELLRLPAARIATARSPLQQAPRNRQSRHDFDNRHLCWTMNRFNSSAREVPSG